MAIPDFDSIEEAPRASKRDPLHDTAEKLRKAWIEECRRHFQRTTGSPSNYLPGPRLDGGRDSHGSVFKPVWPGLAKFVIDNNLEPVRYVKAQFVGGKPPVSPNMLMGNRALLRYRQSVDDKDIEKELELAKRLQYQIAHVELEKFKLLYQYDTRAAYRAMLLDERVQLTALCRYLFAKSIGDEDIANIYLAPAAELYSEAPAIYEKLYAELLTEELRSYASK